MIIVRRPLRVSVSGAGTDLPQYYSRRGGAVLGFTIDKYVYVVAKPVPDAFIASGTMSATAPDSGVDDALLREAEDVVGIRARLQVVTVGDLPRGMGLGEPSCTTLGLLSVLHALRQNATVTPYELAEQAYDIEANRLGRPVGKQDQYLCAFRGLLAVEFDTSGKPAVQRIPLSDEDREVLESHLQMHFIEYSRSSDTILAEQKQNVDTTAMDRFLDITREHTLSLRENLLAHRWGEIGQVWREQWEQRKALRWPSRADAEIDAIASAAFEAGAEGLKVAGGGAGGVLLTFTSRDNRPTLARRLTALGLREIDFHIDSRLAEAPLNVWSDSSLELPIGRL